jgi:hypothetical protein
LIKHGGVYCGFQIRAVNREIHSIFSGAQDSKWVQNSKIYVILGYISLLCEISPNYGPCFEAYR